MGVAEQRRIAPIPTPSTGRIAVTVINHLGDEVMKVFRVEAPADGPQRTS